MLMKEAVIARMGNCLNGRRDAEEVIERPGMERQRPQGRGILRSKVMKLPVRWPGGGDTRGLPVFAYPR